MTEIFRIAREATLEPVYFGTMRWLSQPASTGGKQITSAEAAIVPGQAHPFHCHPEQEEIIYVLSGKLEQWVEQEKRILGPGDVIFLPKGVVHASYNVGDEDVRLFVVFSPSVGESGFSTIEVADQAPWSGLRAS